MTAWGAAAGVDLCALAADAPAVSFFRTREIAADFFVVANSRVETLLPVSYYNGKMRLVLSFALLVCANTAPAQTSPDPPELARAKAELARVESLVEAGGVPRNRLEQARQAVREAEDQAILRRTLYGSLKVEDLTEPLNKEMLESAHRLFDLQQQRVNDARKLVDQGVLPRMALTPVIEELDRRRKTMDLAEDRVRFWNQLLEMARAEQDRQAELQAGQLAALAQSEENPSYGILSPGRERQLDREFQALFARPLPVSAHGDTVFHRSLGFNHTGRIDVALNPQSAEGRWLRGWLDRMGVPYLAFTRAIPGQATAPHIHIGPPSLRLRVTD